MAFKWEYHPRASSLNRLFSVAKYYTQALTFSSFRTPTTHIPPAAYPSWLPTPPTHIPPAAYPSGLPTTPPHSYPSCSLSFWAPYPSPLISLLQPILLGPLHPPPPLIFISLLQPILLGPLQPPTHIPPATYPFGLPNLTPVLSRL